MGKKKWTADDMPDQTGKVVIITGANSGTGFQATKAFVKKNATVIMGCRNPKKAKDAMDQILDEYPNAKLDYINIDLSSMNSIKEFAAIVKERYAAIDILLNNAGIMMTPEGKTADGFELQFGVNYLGPFLLTSLLLDALEKAERPRIVNMSSLMHIFGKIHFKDIMWGKKYKTSAAYGQSKLANLLFIRELSIRLREFGFKTICMAAHPGVSKTNLGQNSKPVEMLIRNIGQSALMGALPLLYAATSPDAISGKYYGPDGIIGFKGHPKKCWALKKGHNLKVAKKLWEVSEELTGIKYSFDIE